MTELEQTVTEIAHDLDTLADRLDRLVTEPAEPAEPVMDRPTVMAAVAVLVAMACEPNRWKSDAMLLKAAAKRVAKLAP